MKKDRREFLKIAALAASTINSTTAQAATQRSPRRVNDGSVPQNVILIICDDLGYGDLGSYGSQLPTPNLDRLAQEGMRFTRCNSGHPICSAARAALLTGRYAQRSHTLGAYFPDSPTGMDLSETTLADLFRAKGFHTQAIGKWHLGDRPEYLPTARGFDAWFGVPYSDDMAPLPLMRGTTKIDQDTDRTLLTPRYTEEVLKFLDGSAAQPFFLYLAYSYPHDPARASARFRGRSGFGDYGDSVMEIDWSVGEIIHSLKSKNQFDDTLLIFTSDHGPWFQGSPGTLRGRKGSTFEGGFRVPLMAHWTQGIAPAVAEEWVSNMDWVPTLTTLCGLPPSPNPLDGRDLSAKLRGGNAPQDRDTVLYFMPSGDANKQCHCARKGDWKLRFAQIDGEIYVNDHTMGHIGYRLPNLELYNLRTDPLESYSCAAQHPEIIREIMADVDRILATMPPETVEANRKLRLNAASHHTPPGACPRVRHNPPLPAQPFEPSDRSDT